MSESPTGGLSPLMDMRCKLTTAEKEIERLQARVEELEGAIRYLRSRFLIHAEFCGTLVPGDFSEQDREGLENDNGH